MGITLNSSSSSSSSSSSNFYTDLFLLDFSYFKQITTNQLEQLGFKDSPVAASGREAIQYIDEKQGEVQCILLDIMMPQENGVETLAEIRKHEKFRREHLEPGREEEEPIKVIAVTALKHEEVLSLCEATGEAGQLMMFDGYIEKPATLTKIRDAMETAAIMFASSLPSGLDTKAKKNVTKILAAPEKIERGNSDEGSGGSDPTTDGGGSGGRGGSNEGTDTRNKGSNEIDNGTSSDEKGQTQSKGLGGKLSARSGKEKKHDQINKLKEEEEDDDENNKHKRAASPGLRGDKARPAHSGDTTSAAPEHDLEKYGSNERNVGGGNKSKRAHLNEGDNTAAGNENTDGISNEDATNKKDTTILENPDDKNRSGRRSERSKRNQSQTRHSPSRHGARDVNNADDEDEDEDTGNEKDTDSGEHQGSAGGSGKNSEEPTLREVSPQANSGGSREGSGGSGNHGSGGSGAETTLNIQLSKQGDDMDKDREIQVKDANSPDENGDVPMRPATDYVEQQDAQPQQPQKTKKELEREQNIAGREDVNNHRPCARCNSNETRFCYYNNGLLSQPRHYCRACQRYWTEGGTQRNLPKGSGRRKDRGAPNAHHASGGGGGGGRGGGTNAENPAMNAPAGLAGLANAAGAGPAFMRQPPNIAAAAAVARQQVLLPNSMAGVPSAVSNGSNQLPFNFPGVSAAQIAAAARNGAGGGFGSMGSQPGANAEAAVLAGMHSASNADAHVAQLLSSVAGYDVNLAASLVGFAAARVGEEIARNAKIIHGDSPGADISERVVTLAKITGWRIGTAISTIAMASVEHGMVQADVNTIVQAQLPIVTSQATMEANAILQTMSSSTTSEKPQSETENNETVNNNSSGKKATGSGNSGGSGGTGVDSMLNNVNAQATSAPEATMLAMQQAQQAAVARWMNDLGGAPFLQQQQLQQQQLLLLQQQQLQQQQQQHQQQRQQQQQQQQGDKSAQAAQYASLLMNLTGEAADAKAKGKTNEVKKSTKN